MLTFYCQLSNKIFFIIHITQEKKKFVPFISQLHSFVCCIFNFIMQKRQENCILTRVFIIHNNFIWFSHKHRSLQENFCSFNKFSSCLSHSSKFYYTLHTLKVHTHTFYYKFYYTFVVSSCAIHPHMFTRPVVTILYYNA